MRRIATVSLTMALSVTLALAAGALAGGIPDTGTVSVVTDAGRLVGTGTLHDGALEIELADTAAAFVTLRVSDAAGGVTELQGVIAPDGSLHVVDAGGIMPAGRFAAGHALAFELHTHASVEAQGAGSASPAGEEPAEAGAETLD